MQNKTNLCCLFLALLSFQLLNAQAKITGKVVDQNNAPIIYANTLLLSAVDSSLIKGGLTDLDGFFEVEVNDNSEYILKISYVGYTDYTVTNIVPKDEQIIKLGSIIITEGVALNEVSITARKPFFEQKIDRLVVNVASSISSSGSTALDVLEKSPGVIVNRQSGSVSLIGKEGVVIMINDRVTYQPAESIVQLLEGMSSDNIEKIEFITTPPANFDAEGNAGFINIILKERTDLGVNGNFTLSGGVGEGEIWSGNINLNYRNNKINVFGGYGNLRQSQKQVFSNFRSIDFKNVNTASEVVTDRDPTQLNHNARIGMDYQASGNTIIGFLVSSYNNKWTMDAFNNGYTEVNNSIESRIEMENTERNQWKNFSSNFNVEQKIGDRQKINLNIDYLIYEDENPNDYSTQFFNSSGDLTSEELTRGFKYTPIYIKVGQLDYQNDVSDKFKINTGFKWALTNLDNDVSTDVFQNNRWAPIDQFTNESDLRENIIASYASADLNIDENNSFKFGLRYEYTDSDLTTLKEGKVVDREFGKLFPSIFYSRKINSSQSMNLSYSKRITRPTFNQMAPFAIFLDPNTFFFGNANLQPAFTDNYKIDYRINATLISVQYSREDSTISTFQDRVDLESNQQLYEPVNLSNANTFSTSLSFPVSFGSRWEMQNNILYIWSETKSFYEEQLIQLSQSSLNFNSNHSFKLGKNLVSELGGFYNSSGVSGRSIIQPVYGINFGIQKKFGDGSSLRFNVRDILNSIKFRGGTDIPELGFMTNSSFDFSNRTFSFSYSTTFGNSRLKSSRNRATGSEEERRRVN